MEDYQKRALEEQADIEGKIQRLNAFLMSEAYDYLPLIDRSLLNKQYAAMCNYKDILTRRIERFPAT